MSTRKKTGYSNSWTLDKFPRAKDFVKQLLDSVATGVHPGYYYPETENTDGIRLTIGTYSNTNIKEERKLIANAIVELLDDPDYFCDAIPVASELGLSEAKEWFLNLAKKPINEIRAIKTNNYTNAYFCLVNFSIKNVKEFIEKIKDKVKSENLSKREYFHSLDLITSSEPLWIENDLVNHMKKSIDENQTEQEIAYIVRLILGRYLKSKGWNHITSIAEQLKSSTPCLKQSLRDFINKFIISKSDFNAYGIEALEKLS